MSKIVKNVKELIELIGNGIVIYQKARRYSIAKRSRELKVIREMMYGQN